MDSVEPNRVAICQKLLERFYRTIIYRATSKDPIDVALAIPWIGWYIPE